ncbi:MAG: UDP-N-acetylglucosamine--N-acetylmuramyl-(pentapeptide) pyrophosphoryl-undecaprenol N-acetylglucosamine transferase [Alphaproteobacteria bacterium]|nr:UDP-N-acetylglucosamine--N-acetylmuramyl-(pentapeptide) pyrophosphoryl-undecaprenol N-acetylglucosamine transferase [Alphaproteobacteria bacterium]
MKVVLCAGGTGGHLFPAIALAEALEGKHHEVTMVTDDRGAVYCEHFEKKKVYKSVRFSLKGAFVLLFRLLGVFISFLRFCKSEKPDVIVGFGGVFTVVPVIVGRMCGVKIVLYEQNTIIGRANRYLLNFADLKLSAFSIGGSWKVQPSPVRKEFLKEIPYRCDEKVKILVIGGSQGAKSFSTIIPSAIKRLSADERSELEIVQQDSYGDIDELKRKYDGLGVKSVIGKFFNNVSELMGKCQLVICRSGSSTLMELAAMGRPAILIPFPRAMDNHQHLNAKRYVDRNAAWLIEEDSYASERLKNILKQILRNREILKQKSGHMYNKALRDASDGFVRLLENVGK